MNEEYLDQIDEMLAQGKDVYDIVSSISSQDGFTGNEFALMDQVIQKKKNIPVTSEPGYSELADQDTPQGPLTTSESGPQGSDFSSPESNQDLLDRAQSDIGDDYAFWLKNALKSGAELEYKREDPTPTLLKFGYEISKFTSIGAGPALVSAARDYFDDDNQKSTNASMPVPPIGSPAYKQWYNSLPSSVQGDVTAPPDYLDYEFTEEQNKLADDLYSKVVEEFRSQEGLKEAIMAFDQDAQNELQRKLDSGEISSKEFEI